ncbi:MAG: SUMF1/EgtB/PvdO family nonheme iron enzyme [Isosphaeraceae bacterium]
MDAYDSSHPSDQTLRAYGVGKLYGDLADSVHSHLGSCADCRQRVAGVSADTFLGRLRDAKVRPESPAPAAPSFADLPRVSDAPGRSPHPVGSIPQDLADHADFEILGELGRGGMGVVYLAQNKLMGRKEVLKVVSRELMDRRGVLERFLREIRSAALLHHANIVTAYSAFRAGESIVFAMEYVDGQDLASYVKAQGPLPVVHAAYFISQAALGLQYAHEKGLVHRDIKPSNLILAREGRRAVVKVLDFGLAKATREGPVETGLTREGQMLGTPDYIAPEQSLDAAKADIRADIYSLGCTLHYVLTGAPPFQGASLYEILQAHHSMESKPLNLLRPDVPWELAAVVAKMMAKDPDRRYQTPSEVAMALKPFYKPGESDSNAGKAELSQAGPPPPVECSVPAALAKVAPSLPTPAGSEQVKPARPVSIWQSLVGLDSAKRKWALLDGAAPLRVWPPPPWVWPVVAGVLLLGLIIWWAPGVLKLKTSDGVIVVENVPESAVVEVDGQKVPVIWVKGEPVRIEAPPGKHHVLVKRGRDLLLDEPVTLESGKPYALSVRRIPAKDALLVLENVPAKATVELDGENVPVAPTAGQPLEIAAYPGRHGVVVKQGPEVLLAQGVTLESGREVKRSVALKEPVVTQAPAVAAPMSVSSPSSGVEPANRRPASKAPAPSEPPAHWTSQSTGMTLIRIQGGEFMMGSPGDDKEAAYYEKPQHKVRISPFYLGVTEVTQEQYQTVMGVNPSWFSSTGGGKNRGAGGSTGRLPVEQVSWLDAVRFCNALSNKDKLTAYYKIVGDNVRIPNPKGSGYRLPTEAEWEYACRAGTATKYSFGDDSSELRDSAWYSRNAGGTTHPVGQKRANAFGLYDMHGNVWEWCWDWYSDSYYKEPIVDDPRGPSGASCRVIRGGAQPAEAEAYPAERVGAECGISDPNSRTVHALMLYQIFVVPVHDEGSVIAELDGCFVHSSRRPH